MSEAKFTKGRWVAGRADMATDVDGYPSKWVYAGDKYCAIASGSDIEDWNEVMANAHLIAAAPDMYEMLDVVMCRLADEVDDEARQIVKEILVLRKKARGEA